jgi:hypothetical protein
MLLLLLLLLLPPPPPPPPPPRGWSSSPRSPARVTSFYNTAHAAPHSKNKISEIMHEVFVK